MKIRTAALTAAALIMGFSAATQAFADTVYNQPVALNVGYFSYSYVTAYDDFTLASGATITSVDWAGNRDFGPTPAPTSFTLSFYSDTGGNPGTLLGATTVGDGNPVDIGADANGYEVYSYSAAVNPFTASAGTQYWLSVFDNDTDNVWAWETGTGGDGLEISIEAGFVIPASSDLAFSLNTSPSAAPEPSSLLLLGTSLLGAAGIARRRFVRG